MDIRDPHPTGPVEAEVVRVRSLRHGWGVLFAIAEPGRGRVALITDSGWIVNAALTGQEAGGVVIKVEDHDNREIIRRLTRWAAGVSR